MILALVAIHILAILFYLVKKKDNLIRPMITGEKEWDTSAPIDPGRAKGSTGLAIIVVVVLGAVVWYVPRRGGG